MQNPFESPEVDKEKLNIPDRLEGQRVGPAVPRSKLWTLVLMKMTGFMLMLNAGLMFVLLLDSVIDERRWWLLLTLLGPVCLGVFGILFFRSSKFSVLVSCLIALAYFVLIFIEYISYLKSELYVHNNAVFPFGIYMAAGMAGFHFLAAYFLSQSWRYLRWL